MEGHFTLFTQITNLSQMHRIRSKLPTGSQNCLYRPISLRNTMKNSFQRKDRPVFEIKASAASIPMPSDNAWERAQQVTELPVPMPVHNLKALLDYKPRLTALDQFGCLALGTLCASVTAQIMIWTGKIVMYSPRLASALSIVPSWLLQGASWTPLLLIGLAAFLGYRAGAYFTRERYYKAVEVSPEYACYDDSIFADVLGVRAHFQAEDGSATEAAPAYGVHLWHGFGANSSSFALVLGGIAQALQAIVVAADKPGFGLTHRPKELGKYSAEFNGVMGRRLLEMRLQQASVGRQFASDLGSALYSVELPSKEPQQQQGEQAPAGPSQPPVVLLGHSLGGLSAAMECVRDPRGVSHLVLVAPAIMPAVQLPGVLQKILNPLIRLGRYLAGLAVVLGSPFILYVLRTLVRNKTFWVQGLRAVRYDKAGLTDALLDGYRRPSVCKDWDYGLVRFLRSSLSGYTSNPITSMMSPGDNQAGVIEQLAVTLQRNRIKCLIIHGKDDRVVPLKNSVALQKALGGEGVVELLELDETGHVPMEEEPEKFVQIVEDFIKRKS